MDGSRWYQNLWLVGISMGCLVLFLFPVYWMIITTLKPPTEILTNPPQLFPTKIDLSAWNQRIVGDPRILRYFLNSMAVSSGTTLLTLVLAAPAAYGLAHLPLRGKSLLLLISLTSLMFPAIMLATPLFVIFSALRFTDSYVGLILANTSLAIPFAITVLRPHFLAVPPQLTEAALIDGCNRWTAFLRVALPLATPGLLTAAIFSFLFSWSELVFAISLTSDDRLRPITAGLWHFIGSNVTQWSSVMALSMLTMLPPMILFLGAQRSIITGLTEGALKE